MDIVRHRAFPIPINPRRVVASLVPRRDSGTIMLLIAMYPNQITPEDFLGQGEVVKVVKDITRRRNIAITKAIKVILQNHPRKAIHGEENVSFDKTFKAGRPQNTFRK